jgi:hypothetical protein
MSEIKEKRNEDELNKLLGSVWLVATIVCWIIYNALGAPVYLSLIALSVTIGGPAIVGLIYYLKKGMKEEGFNFEEMINDLWLTATILSWIYYLLLSASVIILIIAIIITITGPARIGFKRYRKKP